MDAAPSLVPARMPGLAPRLVRWGARALAGPLRIAAAQELAARTAAIAERRELARALLDALAIRRMHRGAPLPGTGGLLFVSNHPFGVLDALVWLEWLETQRSDWRFLGLSLWNALPQLCGSLIPVDAPSADPAANRAAAARAVREGLRWLRAGHALGLFPAGEVACWRWSTLQVEECPWNELAGRLVLRSDALVVPSYVPGRNGWLFQIAAALCPRLRNALLLRELFAQRSRTIEVRTGAALTARQLRAESRDAAVIAHSLRSRVLALTAARAGSAHRSLPLTTAVDRDSERKSGNITPAA